MPLRVAIVQFFPKIGHVRDNIDKARLLCAKLKPHSVDIVCLPEMIFSGYVFRNAAAIQPHLEAPRTGPTSIFCSELAARLNCYVAAGYCERLQSGEVAHGFSADGVEVKRIGANSAVVYGPDGEWVHGSRKTNLYDTDMSWAIPGTGFATLHLPPPLNTVTLGICMDLNARPEAPWTVDGGPFEIADHCLETQSNVLLLLNSWLDSKADLDEENDWQTLNFWASRLRPLWAKQTTPALSDDGEAGSPALGHKTTVIICNRTGEENGITFAGTSAVFNMQRGLGTPKLVDMYGRRQEAVEIWFV